MSLLELTNGINSGELLQLKSGKDLDPSQIYLQGKRDTLLSSLRGQTVRIPNLRPYFSNWPSSTSSHVDRLREDVRQWLEKTLPAGKFCDAFQASDFGFFGATWWPHASFERMKIVTYFIIWLFEWDDEVDDSHGSMWVSFENAQRYRSETLAYARYTLALDLKDPGVTNPIILNFKVIAEALCESYDIDHRKILYEELCFLAEQTEAEQRMRLTGHIPSLDEFWAYRLGSSAVPTCLALIEFSWDGMHLPVGIYQDRDLRAILKHSNTLVSAVNDLLSIKKEIANNATDSLLPIIYHEGKDIKLAIEQVVAFISREIQNLDEAEKSLLARYPSGENALHDHLKNFVTACKQYNTGNLEWSLRTQRYGIEFAVDASGDIIMVL